MFKVPNEFRVRGGPLSTDDYDGNMGAFLIPYNGIILQCIADFGSEEIPFEHVSVTILLKNRKTQIPNCDEMCKAKDYFCGEEDVVMQLHPKKSEYVNQHPHVLHLWRPYNKEIPTPPSIAVGIKK